MITDVVYNELLKNAEYDLYHYPQFSALENCKYKIKRLIRRKSTPVRNCFSWPNAMLAMALQQTGQSIDSYFDIWIQQGMKFSCIDNVMNGCSLLPLYSKTKKEKYKTALDQMSNFVTDYPILPCGSLPYNKKTPQDVYVDAIGTVVPFLCQYGAAFDNKASLALGVKQIDNFIKYGMDGDTGLPYQGYQAETCIKQGIIGWGRSVGWLLWGLLESLDSIEEESESERLCSYFIDLVEHMKQYQREDGYYTWQLQAVEGPVDTSATAMIGYAVAKACNKHILQESNKKFAKKALAAIEQSVVNGRIINGSGECLGFGQYPQWNYGAYPWTLGPSILLMNEVRNGNY